MDNDASFSRPSSLIEIVLSEYLNPESEELDLAYLTVKIENDDFVRNHRSIFSGRPSETSWELGYTEWEYASTVPEWCRVYRVSGSHYTCGKGRRSSVFGVHIILFRCLNSAFEHFSTCEPWTRQSRLECPLKWQTKQRRFLISGSSGKCLKYDENQNTTPLDPSCGF